MSIVDNALLKHLPVFKIQPELYSIVFGKTEAKYTMTYLDSNNEKQKVDISKGLYNIVSEFEHFSTKDDINITPEEMYIMMENIYKNMDNLYNQEDDQNGTNALMQFKELSAHYSDKHSPEGENITPDEITLIIEKMVKWDEIPTK